MNLRTVVSRKHYINFIFYMQRSDSDCTDTKKGEIRIKRISPKSQTNTTEKASFLNYISLTFRTKKGYDRETKKN